MVYQSIRVLFLPAPPRQRLLGVYHSAGRSILLLIATTILFRFVISLFASSFPARYHLIPLYQYLWPRPSIKMSIILYLPGILLVLVKQLGPSSLQVSLLIPVPTPLPARRCIRSLPSISLQIDSQLAVPSRAHRLLRLVRVWFAPLPSYIDCGFRIGQVDDLRWWPCQGLTPCDPLPIHPCCLRDAFW